MRNFPVAVIFKESFQESFQESLSCPFSSACEGHRFQTKFHRLKIPTAKKQKIENTSKVILLILKKQKKYGCNIFGLKMVDCYAAVSLSGQHFIL